MTGKPVIPISPKTSSDNVKLIAVLSTFLVLALVSVILRLVTRLFILRKTGWDDTFMVLSAATFTAWAVGNMYTTTIIKPNQTLLSLEDLTKLTNSFLAIGSLYIWTMVLLKISLSIFFLRILIEKWQKRVAYMVLVLSTVIGVFYFIENLFQCGIPNAAGTPFWARKMLGRCIPQTAVTAFAYVHGGVNSFTDICIFVITLPMISVTKINRREKIVVASLLTFALSGCIASVVRLKWVASATGSSSSIFTSIENLAILTIIECGFGIFSGCCITLRPLVVSLNSRFNGNRTGTSQLSRSAASRNKSRKSGNAGQTGPTSGNLNASYASGQMQAGQSIPLSQVSTVWQGTVTAFDIEKQIEEPGDQKMRQSKLYSVKEDSDTRIDGGDHPCWDPSRSSTLHAGNDEIIIKDLDDNDR